IFWRNLLIRTVLRHVNQLIATLLMFVTGYLFAFKLNAIAMLTSFVTGLAALLAPSAAAFSPTLLINLTAATLIYGVSCLVIANPLFSLYNRWIDASFEATIHRSCAVIDRIIFNRLAALQNALQESSLAIRDLYDQSETKWATEANYFMGLLE